MSKKILKKGLKEMNKEMNKELHEALTICRENEAKLEKIYDKMYTFWKRNIEPCLEQGKKYSDIFTGIDGTLHRIGIPSGFLCYGAGRSEIIKNWPVIKDVNHYATPELIIQAMIIWLEKTSCEINKDRGKLSSVYHELRKFTGETNE